ncbi:sialin-like [Ornithodoros turicata]|uniref:sialin-like n=1 Tax=Ornithodoros turicata TaxID=34597 RepID=UPI003138DF27
MVYSLDPVSRCKEEEKKPRRAEKSCVQYRHVLVALGFLGLANVYGMRVNLNVALVAMVNHTAVQETTLPSDCPLPALDAPSYNTSKSPSGARDGPFIWDPVLQGIVLGSFFYGYIITPIPGGRMSEAFGAKWLFGLGTFFTGLLSLLIPVAAYAGEGYLIAVRVLQGIGEGVTYPAIEAQVAHWIPINQRATAVSLIHAGGFFGVAVGMYISGLLAATDFLGGWPSVFYVFGIWTCIWFVLWAVFTSNTPDEHPWAGSEEILMIEADLADQKPTLEKKLPWSDIATSLPVFGVVMAHFGTHWLQYVLVSELPTYLGTVLHFDISKNGFYSALPYVGAIVAGSVSGVAADYMRSRRYMSATGVRKLFNGLAHFVPSVMLLIVPSVGGCNGFLNLVLFVIAGTVRGTSEAGYMAIPVDMAPAYAGTILGICVCIGNTTGFIVPYITGILTAGENTVTQWSYSFYIAGGVGLFTGLCFQLFASAEVQSWGLGKRRSIIDDKQLVPNGDVQDFEVKTAL